MAVRYTEHEKLSKVQKDSQVIGEFIEWMQSEQCYTVCELVDDDSQFVPVRFNIQDILAKYFKINLNNLEKEKRHMLTYMRGANNE